MGWIALRDYWLGFERLVPMWLTATTLVFTGRFGSFDYCNGACETTIVGEKTAAELDAFDRLAGWNMANFWCCCC